jgi:hypothetical protein
MSAPKSRADDLIETWTRATGRPAAAFVVKSPRRRRRTKVALVALAIVILAGALVGAMAIGGYLHLADDRHPPADLATSVVQAIATAPGVRYSLMIASHYSDGTIRLESSGVIDFQQGRFSGTADGGGGDSAMLLFGGPSSGAVVVVDGLFVQTEGGSWEHVPDRSTPLDGLVDPVGLSNAVKRALDSSQIDPAVRFAPCGTETCQVVGVSAPAQALFDLESLLVGQAVQPPSPDLGPTNVELFIDPPSGFPVRMETRITAGATTTL